MRAVKNGSIKWTHKDGVVTYSIAEATEPLLFVVNEKDISKAKILRGTGDPNLCVAACAVRRQYNDAAFQRDTAYILQVWKGRIFAIRYRFSNSLRKAIVNFDNGSMFPKGSYMLLPPSPSQTLEAKRLNRRKIPATKRIVRSHTKFTARGKILPVS